MAINNIRTVGHEGAPLQTLTQQIVRAYHKRGDVQTTLLWVVDGEKLSECLGSLRISSAHWRSVNITVVCFLPQTIRDQQPYRELRSLSRPISTG